MVLLSLTSITLLTICNTLDILWMWNYPFIKDKLVLKHIMTWDIKTGTITWFLAKQSMYFLFLLRLHTAYKSSIYSYNVKHLTIIAVIAAVAVLISIINVLIYTEIKGFYYPKFPFAVHFNSYYPLWVLMLAGGPDAIMSILFIYLFTKPLKMVIRNIGKTAETKDGILELYNTGIKALVLTSMSTLTTLVFLLMLLFTNTLVILPIDSVINCLCMMMITPYYPDKEYYERICALPVALSQKWTNSIRDLNAMDHDQLDESKTTNTTTMQVTQTQMPSISAVSPASTPPLPEGSPENV